MTISGTPSRAISKAWTCRSWCGAKRRRTPAATGQVSRGTRASASIGRSGGAGPLAPNPPRPRQSEDVLDVVLKPDRWPMNVSNAHERAGAVLERVEGVRRDGCRFARSKSRPRAGAHDVEGALDDLILLRQAVVDVWRRGHRSSRERELHPDELAAAVCRGRGHRIDAAVEHLKAVSGLRHVFPRSPVWRQRNRLHARSTRPTSERPRPETRDARWGRRAGVTRDAALAFANRALRQLRVGRRSARECRLRRVRSGRLLRAMPAAVS